MMQNNVDLETGFITQGYPTFNCMGMMTYNAGPSMSAASLSSGAAKVPACSCLLLLPLTIYLLVLIIN